MRRVGGVVREPPDRVEQRRVEPGTTELLDGLLDGAEAHSNGPPLGIVEAQLTRRLRWFAHAR